MPLTVTSTSIPGVVIVDTTRVADQRGSFARLYCDEELREVLGARQIRQINHSLTTNLGAVRGMHFQLPPHAETKMVRCLRGKVWDVAVDLRAGSPTFLRWHAEELSGTNARMMIVPEGCAHGFQVLESGSELLYLHTAAYAPGHEGGVSYADPLLRIAWPLAPTDLSVRDRDHALLSATYAGIELP